ncbi:MAG: glycosyltransferase family 4 protein [Candidatus Eisenbacteria bacterium]
MRILLLSYRDLEHPEQGGAEVIIHQIYQRLQERGHPVTFLTCRFAGGAERTEIDGMEVIRVGNLYNFNFLAPWYARRHLQDRIDVVVEDLNKLPFYSPLFLQRPVLVNIPHLFGTTVFQQAAFPLASYVYAQEKTIPHVYRDCEFQVLSDSTGEDLQRRHIDPGQIHVIRSGIDHRFYRPPSENGQRGKVLLYLGRLKKYKCIEYPIRVLPQLARKHPEVEYWIAGEGDYRDELAEIARAEGVADRVKFLGYVEGRAKQEMLHATRILLYTSPKEGWGLSVIEANATGVPCVASNSPGLRESVRDRETGFLVPHGDLPALADRLDQLLADEDLWRGMSQRGIEWAGRFSWERMADETLALLERSAERYRTREDR